MLNRIPRQNSELCRLPAIDLEHSADRHTRRYRAQRSGHRIARYHLDNAMYLPKIAGIIRRRLLINFHVERLTDGVQRVANDL